MTNASKDRTLGVILAGGQSRRMGQQDKCLLELAGKNLVANAIDRATGQVGSLVVATNGDTSRFGPLKCPVIQDTLPGFLGPAAGIISAYEWAQQQEWQFDWLMAFAADTPRFPKTLTQTLLNHTKLAHSQVGVPCANGRHHYVLSLWHRKALEQLKIQMGQGTRALKHIIASLPHTAVNFDQDSAFFNINTPEQWREFLQSQ